MRNDTLAATLRKPLAPIGIMGTPVDTGNRGVLALGASLINLCMQCPDGAGVVLLQGNLDNKPVSFRVNGEFMPIPVVNSRMSPRAKLRDHFFWILAMSLTYRLLPIRYLRSRIAAHTPWIKTVVEAKFVGNIHGGDSFSDIYGVRGFLSTFFFDWAVLMVKGTMVQFPQTYGPYKGWYSRWLARYILNRSSPIIARDKQSRLVAQELVGPKKEILLCPDVAFSLTAIRPEKIEMDPPLVLGIPTGIIGLNVNGLMYNGGYTRSNMFGLKLDYAALLPELVCQLLSENSNELWLVPHTFAASGSVESDPEASRCLREALPPALQKRVRIVSREYDQYEIKGVIGLCDFFIGSRMHACIAALSQGIPCVGIAYSMKFAGVFESVGMEDWIIEGRSIDNQTAIARTIELYRQRDSARTELHKSAEEARKQLTSTFARLVR